MVKIVLIFNFKAISINVVPWFFSEIKRKIVICQHEKFLQTGQKLMYWNYSTFFLNRFAWKVLIHVPWLLIVKNVLLDSYSWQKMLNDLPNRCFTACVELLNITSWERTNMSLSQVDKHKSNCLRLEVTTLPFFHFKTHFQLRKKKNLNKFKFTTMHSFFSYLVSMIKIRFWEAQKQQFMARIN